MGVYARRQAAISAAILARAGESFVSSESEPSPELLELLKTRLDTLEKLEVVLAVRDAPGAMTTLDELSAKLRMPVEIVRSVVGDVNHASLLAFDGSTVRLVVTPNQATTLAEVAR